MPRKVHSQVPEFFRRVFARALLLIYCGAALVVLLSPNAHNSAVQRGDYPAFYAASQIVVSDQANRLYDLDLQRQIQQETWPMLKQEDGFLPFLYPASVAVLLSPLALLPPWAGKLLLSALMFLCLWKAIGILLALRPLLAQTALEREHLLAVSLFVTFAPVGQGIMGAQNTALSMLLMALLFRALVLKTASAERWAGLALGLWLMKPHFPLLCGLFLLFAKKWRILGWASGAGALFLSLAVWQYGLWWPLDWAEKAFRYKALDEAVNGHQMVSLLGIQGFVGASTALSILIPIAWTAVLLYGIWMFRELRSEGPQSERALLRVLSCLGVIVVLLSPHALTYELGLAVLPIVLLLDIRRRFTFWMLPLLALLSAPLVLFPNPWISLSVLVFLFAFFSLSLKSSGDTT